MRFPALRPSALCSALRIAAGAALLTLAVVAMSATRPALADEVDDTIGAMEQAAKDKDAGLTIAKMVQLQDNLDERVTKALTKLIRSHDDKIAAAAIKQVAMRKDASLAKALKSRLDDKKVRKDHRDVYLAYLDAAAMYADKKLGDVLIDVVKKHMDVDSEIATRAIKAYGTVGDAETVDQLIEWLGQAEVRGGGSGGKNPSQETLDNRGRAKNQIVATLEDLTDISITDCDSWREFWESRRKTFKFPDRNAPEVDPATLTEWEDPAYGYKIVKPEGEGWSFRKPSSDDVRIWLDYTEKDEVIARIQIMLHNLKASSSATATLDGLVKWYRDTDFPENRFDEIRDEVTVRQESFGKRDCQIVEALGNTKSGWGASRIRAYLTQVNHMVVRVEGIVRLGAEKEVFDTVWKTIESMPFDN